MLSGISTEVLVKLRERYLNGRTRFFVLAEGCEDIQQKMIDAIEKELRRRFN